MTIRVTVTNSDTRESAVIKVQQQLPNGDAAAGTVDKELKGGEAEDFWVHSGLQFVVSEVGQ